MIEFPERNILYLAHRVPYPPDKGDRIRSFHVLRHLTRFGRVFLACLADEPVRTHVMAALRRLCFRVGVPPIGRERWLRAFGTFARGRTVTEGAFRSPALRTTVRQWAEEVAFDAAVVSASSMVPYLRLPELAKVPAVIDLVDVDSQKWLDYGARSRGWRAWFYRTEGRRLRELEKGLPTWARAVVLVGEAEASLYRQFCLDGPVHAVTNGVDLEHFRPRAVPAGLSCVFAGALDYRPNVEGISWFCREAWPAIHRRFPHARLRIVGRKPTPAVWRLAQVAGVQVVGQVPDMVPELARAAVVVVPLLIARGVQNKILEGLAMGKATVASPAPLAGLKARPGIHLLAASTPEEWVAVVCRLLTDPDLRRRLGSAGRRYAEENHCWERCLEPFGALLGFAGADRLHVAQRDDSLTLSPSLA